MEESNPTAGMQSVYSTAPATGPEKTDIYLDLARKLENVKSEGSSDFSCNWRALNGPQRFGKLFGLIRNQMNLDHQTNIIVKIGQNTQMASTDFQTLANGSMMIFTSNENRLLEQLREFPR